MPMPKFNIYFNTLNRIVSRDYDTGYNKLISALYLTPVNVSLMQKMCPDDINRCMDGIRIRQKYCDDYEKVNEYDCSWLELMIGLASRMQCLLDIAGQDDRTNIWFWYMLNDWLGSEMLDNINDKNTPRLDIVDYLDYIRSHIDRLELRTYESDGFGGLFYVPNLPVDMRTLPLWYQMQKKVSFIVSTDPTYQ